MIPVVQSRIGDDGTCFRAAIASLLELPEAKVPDWAASNQDSGVNPWLQGRGLKYSEVPASDPAPIGLHLALGTSPRGGQHAVVMRDGKLVHDPHPPDGTGRGLVDVSHWGVLTPVAKDAVSLSPDRDGEMQLSYTALDAAVIRGKELSAAAQELLRKHNDIKADPSRTGLTRSGSYESMYHATVRPIEALFREAEVLLNASRISDKTTWKAKLDNARKHLINAKDTATKGAYRDATSSLEYTLMITHHIIDALRALARRTGAQDSKPVDRYVDLLKQGFMKQGRGRPMKTAKPIVRCDKCSDWHREGKHTKKAKDSGAAVEELVQAYKNGGNSVAITKFEQIAKRDKLKSYEAEMLKIGFQRAVGLAKDTLPDPVPPCKPGDTITLKNGKRATVTKVLPAKNLFGEKEFHVSTKTGEVLPVSVRGKDVYGWSEGTPSAVIKKAQEVAKKQSAAALQRDREREAREYLKRGGGSRVAEAEAKRVLTKDADATTAWQVWSRGGSIGNKGPSLISEHPTREEAAAKAKRMNKLLSPGEKSYYGLGYGIKESGRVKDRTRMHRALDRALDVVQMKGSK